MNWKSGHLNPDQALLKLRGDLSVRGTGEPGDLKPKELYGRLPARVSGRWWERAGMGISPPKAGSGKGVFSQESLSSEN